MKTRIISLLLVGVLAVSITGCGEVGVAQTVIEEEEFSQMPIPDAVTYISEEDDKALTGTLTEDYYINPYFGIQLNKAEGGTISSLFDEGTELALLSKTYLDGNCGIYIYDTTDDGNVYMSIAAAGTDEKGKTEEQLMEEKAAFEQSINESMEYEADCGVETLKVAGEDHPAYIEKYTDEETGKVSKYANLTFVKGDFVLHLSISGNPDNFDDFVALLEKY